MDRIISMITRRLIGRLVNKGVDAGIDKVSRIGKKSAPKGQGDSNAPQQGGKQP